MSGGKWSTAIGEVSRLFLAYALPDLARSFHISIFTFASWPKMPDEAPAIMQGGGAEGPSSASRWPLSSARCKGGPYWEDSKLLLPQVAGYYFHFQRRKLRKKKQNPFNLSLTVATDCLPFPPSLSPSFPPLILLPFFLPSSFLLSVLSSFLC